MNILTIQTRVRDNSAAEPGGSPRLDTIRGALANTRNDRIGMDRMAAPLDPAWTTFFATAAGAAATLVGLIMVAVSVNLQRILAYRQLPSRAGAGIGALVLNLSASMAALIPQPVTALGVEVICFAAAAWLVQLWSARQMICAPPDERRSAPEMTASIGLGQAQVLPFVVGGVLVLAGHGGVYWIAGGVVATFASAVFNAWVLLVEILR